jgi:DNA recombination protein RmuC
MTAVWILLGVAVGVVIVGVALRAQVVLTRTHQARVEQLQRDVRERDTRIGELQRERDVRLDTLQREHDARVAELQRTLTDTRVEATALRERLEHERHTAADKLALLDDAQRKLGDAFRALSADALTRNNETFLEIARNVLGQQQQLAKGDLETRAREVDSLIKPLRESLDKVDGRIGELEKARAVAYGTLAEQVRSLAATQQALHAETQNLVRALRAPQVRGRWGEIQLKRVVELAGMVEYCDFMQQESIVGEDGRLRPDMIVRLPNGRTIVVDSKAPLQAYLEAIEAQSDELRIDRMRQHGQQLRMHIRKLSEKAYWERLPATPEFVVLFLPGESFYGAALDADPSLLQEAAEQRVVIATPTTLIALLRAISYGWRQETITREAQHISAIGRELYHRVLVMAQHFSDMRRALDRTVSSYNKVVRSLESRVLPSARKFKELGASSNEDIPALDTVDQQARELQSPELTAGVLRDEEIPAAPRVIQTEL